MSVCLLLAVYEWSLPADGCSCVCLAWMYGFRDALEKKKSSQNAICNCHFSHAWDESFL